MTKTAAQRNGTKEALDYEALAAKQREARATKCSEKINQALSEFNCQLSIRLQIGDQQVPLQAVVSLPGIVAVEAK